MNYLDNKDSKKTVKKWAAVKEIQKFQFLQSGRDIYIITCNTFKPRSQRALTLLWFPFVERSERFSP